MSFESGEEGAGVLFGTTFFGDAENDRFAGVFFKVGLDRDKGVGKGEVLVDDAVIEVEFVVEMATAEVEIADSAIELLG